MFCSGERDDSGEDGGALRDRKKGRSADSSEDILREGWNDAGRDHHTGGGTASEI